MKTLSLLALGALTLSACDFAGGSPDLAALPVASIEASGLAVPAGVADADGRIDRFVEIQNAVGQTIWRSATTDADPAEAFTVTVPEAVQVASSTQGVLVAVYDYDTNFTSGSQLISRSQTFTATDLATATSLTREAVDDRGRTTGGSFTITSAAQ